MIEAGRRVGRAGSGDQLTAQAQIILRHKSAGRCMIVIVIVGTRQRKEPRGGIYLFISPPIRTVILVRPSSICLTFYSLFGAATNTNTYITLTANSGS